MAKKRSILISAMFATAVISAQQKVPQLGKDPIDDVIGAMTDDEKASLVLGTGMPGFDGLKPTPGVNEGRVPGAAGATFAIPRLGIPALVLSDGPAGLRIKPNRINDDGSYYATAFPVGTSLASTWNLPLIENIGKAMGNEVREYGVDVLLAPALNIHRNPLNGRNFEYYSEDPLVAGKTAAAIVNGVESQGVGTSIKHFAANNQETNRMSINEHVSERAMREIYLRNFEIAVKESQPWTVMSSYNLINGKYTSERKDLLTEILRNEWGFKGLVMSDWFAGYSGFKDITNSDFSSDVAAQLSAGNDLIMPGMAAQKKAILADVSSGKLSKANLDKNVKRVLELVLESPFFRHVKTTNKPNLKANAELTRQAAAEGMVLLKNENALPVADRTKQIALFGTTSYNFISGGTGSGDVNEAYTISLLEGLKNAGYKISSNLENKYVPYTKELKQKDDARREKEGVLAKAMRFAEPQLDRDDIEKSAQQDDFAIITIGRNAGEDGDRKVADDFDLADDEQHLINVVSSAFHRRNKKVIAILNVGGVVETASWKDRVDAILVAWQPGQEGGNSVADVISGNVNPSGKLTSTWPMRYADVPSAKNFPGTPSDDPKEVTYEEGIYVGYRYFQTFDVKPSYEFGFGKSYTTFDYSGLKLASKKFKNALKLTVTVKNTGKVAGKEVVQLYISAPAKNIDKPKMELKAFTKTKLLKPGETEVLSVTLHERDLASFLENKSAWIAEKGTYTVSIGASSSDIRQTATFVLPSEITVEKTTKAFAQDKSFTDLKPTKG